MLSMSTFVAVALTPFVFVSFLALLPLAIFTTSVAFTALSIQVVFTYIELVSVLARHLFSRPNCIKPYSPKPPKSASHSPASSNEAERPRSSQSMSPSAKTTTRDFEGVGGWRIRATNEEYEYQWLAVGARLELPRLSSDFQSRSHSPEILSARRFTKPRPKSAVVSGDTSPEDWLTITHRPKSMIALADGNFNLGKGKMELRRKSSTSSTSSSGILLQGQRAT